MTQEQIPVKKVVRYIDGHLVMRPSKNHPDPNRWAALKEACRTMQRIPEGVKCATCWVVESENYGLDLHHRHYDNFGNENMSDVVLICRLCHEAITQRIRAARFAAGDRSGEVMVDFTAGYSDIENAEDRFRPQVKQTPETEPDQYSAEVLIRFRPVSRY
jgi:hypothetical protein